MTAYALSSGESETEHQEDRIEFLESRLHSMVWQNKVSKVDKAWKSQPKALSMGDVFHPLS